MRLSIVFTATATVAISSFGFVSAAPSDLGKVSYCICSAVPQAVAEAHYRDSGNNAPVPSTITCKTYLLKVFTVAIIIFTRLGSRKQESLPSNH